jgi:hypothetical protein
VGISQRYICPQQGLALSILPLPYVVGLYKSPPDKGLNLKILLLGKIRKGFWRALKDGIGGIYRSSTYRLINLRERRKMISFP